MKYEKPLPEELARDPIVGTAQAAKATNNSPQYLRYLARVGKFPLPLRIGDRKLGWRLSTIMRHIDEREAEANNIPENRHGKGSRLTCDSPNPCGGRYAE